MAWPATAPHSFRCICRFQKVFWRSVVVLVDVVVPVPTMVRSPGVS